MTGAVPIRGAIGGEMTTANWATLDSTALARVLPGLPAWPWSRGDMHLTPIGGGLNNRNWRLDVMGEAPLFLKVPGVGTEAFVDRATAIAAARSAAARGIAPAWRYDDPGSGITVTAFLEGYRPLTELELATSDAIVEVVRTYRILHGGPLLPRTRTVSDEIDAALEHIGALAHTLPSWAAPVLAGWRRAEAALRAAGSDLAPCHNDPNFTNMMVRQGAPLQLVDYDFASNNDPSYEVLGMLGFYPVPERTRFALIEEYYGRYELAHDARMRLMTLAIYVRFGLWALGNALERDDDYDYEKYGMTYFVMANDLLRDPRWESWLRAL